jgi:hypothetical protein
MAKSGIVDVWFYVDPTSKNIDSVICWFPMGMSQRVEGDWVITDKEEAGIYDTLAKHDVYQLDWTTDPLEINEDLDFDDSEIDHAAVKLYDKGELTLDILKDHSEKIIDASELESMDDMDVED